MNLSDALIALTHVATQLTGRWYPAPSVHGYHNFMDTHLGRALHSGLDFHEIESEDWEDLLIDDQSKRSPLLFWLPVLLQRKPQFIHQLASATSTHFKNMVQSGGNFLLINSPLYPTSLKTIAKPPLLLSYLGARDALMPPKIAVIGSRQVSYFGIRESVVLGEMLSSLEVCVVSGGAIGCDIAVHQGMLSSGHDKIAACAVFAGGLSSLYPRRHARVFDQLLGRGAIFLSERLWWQSSQPRDFPIRNRIVSGLSEAVVVMLAGESSGALITADEALEQGRDVYVLEHPPGDVRALGSAKLLDEGAMGFRSAEQLVDALRWRGFSQNENFLSEGACHDYGKIDNVMGEQLIN